MKKRDIDKVKKACVVTDKILIILIKKLKNKEFKTEIDIYNFLKQKTKENNCRLVFKPIVATGKNAAEVHHKPTNTMLKKGFLIIDFGIKYKSYCSDCTRTFYLGKPSKKEKKLYRLVKNIQEICINYAYPGMSCNDLDAIARAGFAEYRIYFKHGLGHGVGKRIHQAPSLAPNKKRYLKKNQIITIEPGLYFKNKFGIRIEDTIIVKEKPVILTKTKKELITI